MATETIAPPTAQLLTQDNVLPQLSFEIDNDQAPHTIYVTTDPTVNKLTLKVTTNATASFTPGTPVPKKQASSGTGSLLYLDLSPLGLTAAEFAKLQLSAHDWRFEPYATGQLICMTPTDHVTLEPGPGNEIDIAIGSLTLAKAPGPSVSLIVTSYRVDGVTLGNLGLPFSFNALIEQPPNGGGNLLEQIEVDVLQPYVVNTVPEYDPVSNSLSMLFAAKSGGLPVPAGEQTQFTLTFVYAPAAPGFGALCTPKEALAIHLRQGVNAHGWGIAQGKDEQNPSWQLTPPAGKPIVGTGTQSTVELLATNIHTRFEAGPTTMYVAWTGVPGYKDGSWAVPLFKAPHVVIKGVTVTPNPSVLVHGVANVEISWEVENAGTLTLSPVGGNVTGKTSVPAQITDPTPITLAADGLELANLGNRALFNTEAQVLPVIDSFVAEPAPVYTKDLPRSIELAWNVNTNGKVTLESSVGVPDPNQYDAVGGVSKPIQGPQVFTLVPVEQPDDLTIRRSLVVSAFTTQLTQQSAAGAARFVAAPPSASYVVVAPPSGSAVTALDTMLYQPIGGPIATGSNPAGMAFSPDGATLYVANSGDGTLTTIGVTATGATPQYTFATVDTLTLGGSPQQVAVSPDGKYVYVTIDNGSSPGSLAVLAAGEDGPTKLAGVTVGVAPRGVAVMPSGAVVYVANSGSNTVTAIGKKPNWQGNEVSTLTGFATKPVGIETSADGDVILVACSGSGTVVAVNATYPNTAPRKSLKVGGSPQQIAVMPGGAYAFVTNQGDGTLSLLGLGATPAACSVVDAAIPAGAGASGVAVSADSGLALVGATAGLSVLTLAQYVQQVDNLPSVGGQPTDVAASPDARDVVAWHNAAITLSPGEPSTGLQVYDLETQAVTPQLQGEHITAFAYHPSADAATGYSGQLGGQTVDVLDSGTWQTRKQLDLAGHTQGSPRRLAVSGDGSMLFVLARDQQFNYDLVIFTIDTVKDAYTVAATLRVYTTSAGSDAELVAGPDGSRAYMIDEIAGKLWVITRDKSGNWAVQANSPVAVGTLPDALALSPDGSRLFVANRGRANYTLVAVDTATLAQQRIVLPPSSLSQLNGLAVSPDGTRLFATDGIMSGIRVFDTASLRLVQTISWMSDVEGPWGIAVAPDASQIFTANAFSDDLGIVQQVQGAAATKQLEEELDPEREAALADDPTYQGLLIRRFLPNFPWTDCPDIWAAGTGPLPDPSILVSQYGQDSPNGITNLADNFLYVRGQNTTSGPLTARVWLYWVNASGNMDLILWPQNWGESGLNVTYIEVSAQKLGDIVYTNPPFILDGHVLTGSHYCLVTVVENPPLSKPARDPRPTTYMGDMTTLAAYFTSHPNMGWKNTAWTSVTQPSWQQTVNVGGPKAGGLFFVGVQCKQMPTDGHYALAMPGPDADGTLNTGQLPITTPGMLNMQPVTWPANYQSTLTLSYYQGATAPTPGVSSISVVGGSYSQSLVGLVDDPYRYARRARIYRRLGREEDVRDDFITLVGSANIQFNP